MNSFVIVATRGLVCGKSGYKGRVGESLGGMMEQFCILIVVVVIWIYVHDKIS